MVIKHFPPLIANVVLRGMSESLNRGCLKHDFGSTTRFQNEEIEAEKKARERDPSTGLGLSAEEIITVRHA